MAGRSGKRRWLGLAVSALAVFGAVAHAIWPNVRIDTITGVLLAVALIPWLGELLESIELPGLKVRYRDLAKRQDELEITAAKADRRADEATSTAQAALGAASIGDDLSSAPPTMMTVELLVAEYHRLRATPRSQLRTAEFDRLFGAMVAVVSKVPDFDVARALRSEDGGMRLASYAFLYGKPDPEHLGGVLNALLDEQAATNQYWAIRTLGVLIDRADPSSVPDSVFLALRDFMEQLPEDTSRRTQIAALLHNRRSRPWDNQGATDRDSRVQR